MSEGYSFFVKLLNFTQKCAYLEFKIVMIQSAPVNLSMILYFEAKSLLWDITTQVLLNTYSSPSSVRTFKF